MIGMIAHHKILFFLFQVELVIPRFRAVAVMLTTNLERLPALAMVM